MNELDNLRLQIDKIDSQLVDLLAERFELIKDIKLYKKAHGINKLDQARFDAMINSLRSKSVDLKLDPDMIEEIWQTIHKYSLKSQN